VLATCRLVELHPNAVFESFSGAIHSLTTTKAYLMTEFNR